MSTDRTYAVALRVLRQLRRDLRTLGMIFVVPLALLWLVDAMFSNRAGVFERVGPLMIGLFPFLLLFLITSIAVQRERSQGTFERLMASPVGRGDILAGYSLAFMLVALIQAAVTLAFGLLVLDVPNEGNLALAFVIVAGEALLGVALGLFLSAFARTEFQAVQFLPAVVFPQLLLAGLFVPVDQLPGYLELPARLMPLTYALDGLERIMRAGHGLGDGRVVLDLAVVAGLAVALLVAGALTLRRSEA
jgi:ABC-2 type transport system permease protein